MTGSACHLASAEQHDSTLYLLVVPSPSDERHLPRHWLDWLLEWFNDISPRPWITRFLHPIPWFVKQSCGHWFSGCASWGRFHFPETEKIKQLEGSSGEMISGLEKLSNRYRHRPKFGGRIWPVPTISSRALVRHLEIPLCISIFGPFFCLSFRCGLFLLMGMQRCFTLALPEKEQCLATQSAIALTRNRVSKTHGAHCAVRRA
jgi:hypothetical protein